MDAPAIGRIELTSNRVVHLSPPEIEEGLRPFVRVEGLPRGLEANKAHAVDVVLHPRLAGSYGGSIAFPTVEGPRVTVRVMGQAGGPWLELLPVDFGYVLLQRTATVTVALTNLTDQDLTLRQLRSTPSVFVVLGPSDLPRRSTAPIEIRFRATEEGSLEATLEVIAAESSGRSERYTTTIRAEGVRSQVGAFPSLVDFGTLVVGETRTRRARLRNLGTIGAPATPVSASPPFSAAPTTSVAIGHSDIDLEVSFAPTEVGRHTAVIRAGAFEVTAVGHAVRVPVPELVISGLDFGTVDASWADVFESRVVLENRGELDLELHEFAPPMLGPIELVDFEPQLLAARDRATFRARLLRLADFTPGTHTAELVLSTNLGSRLVPASYTLVDSPTPNLEVWPPALLLGERLGAESTFGLWITSSGTQTLTTSISVARGSDPRLAIDVRPVPLRPGERMRLIARLSGLGVGELRGGIEIRSNDPDTPVVVVPVQAARSPNPASQTEFSVTALSGDGVELHLVREGYSLFDAPYDACFCNPAPEWGEAGSIDDPQILSEADYGGATSMLLLVVPRGRATLYVRAPDGQGEQPVEVRIGLDNNEFFSASRSLGGNLVWPVGVVESDGGTPAFRALEEPSFVWKGPTECN